MTCKSHVDVVADVRAALRLLLHDPLLNDLRSDVTPDEISSQLALLQGHAFTHRLGTYHDHTISVLVLQGSTVRGLKQAVERSVSRVITSSTIISWRYVWRTYWLACGQMRLENDSAELTNCGIGNHSELRFVRKLKRKRQLGQP